MFSVTWRDSVKTDRISLIKSKAFDVSGIQAELANVEWNQIKLRSEHPDSPHREVDDIWVRYNPIENYHGDMRAFNGPHFAQWYPIADQLPETKRIAEEAYAMLGGTQLGFVLITRIAPGKQCYSHIDQGWHAETYDKFCVQVKGTKDQVFNVDGEELRTEDGDLFAFNNSLPHFVKNDSAQERISMIVCIKSPIDITGEL
jgi:uncharacterized cupin superfamily protein